MDNLHIPSVLKAGGVGAGIAILAGVLGFIPVLGDIIGFCMLCGGFLIPITSGMLYGYFAPGQEDTAQSAVGGALSGGAGGLLLGIFTAISGSAMSAISDAGVGAGDAIVGGIFGSLICACGFGIAGLVLGAIGGVLWPLVQKQMGQ